MEEKKKEEQVVEAEKEVASNNNEKCSCDDECNCDEECNCSCDCTCGCQDNTELKKDKKKHKKMFGKKDDKLKEIEEKFKILDNRKKELEEKILMLSADNVNYRKRKDEEVARLLKFCNEDIIKDLLPVSDNFERALTLAEEKTEPEFVKFNEGYKMVYCSIQNILEKFGVKAIDGANKPFDPIYHNAVMMEEKEGVEPGMVIEVLQKGYLYKDKVIRPAMVKVSE